MSFAAAVFLLEQLLLCVVAVEIREYNNVQYSTFENLQDFQTRFFDSGVATENVLVGVFGDEECRSWVNYPNLLGVQRASGIASLKYATVHTTEFPGGGVDPCAEVLFYKADSDIFSPWARTNNLEYAPLNDFINRHVLPFELNVVNQFPFPVTLVWHDENQEPSIQLVIPAGPQGRIKREINSFIGHLFSVHSGVNNDKFEDIVDFFIAAGRNISIDSSRRLDSCIARDIPYFGGMVGMDQIENVVCNSATAVEQQDEKQCASPDTTVPPHNATHFFAFFAERPVGCTDMAARFVEFSHSLFHEKRLALNFVVPQMIRPVTRDGFRKLRVPDATHRWLKQWFLDERTRQNRETESDAGPCMNQHAAPTEMTHLTPSLKDRLSEELYPILHDWYLSDSYHDGEPVAEEDRPDDTYERMTGWRARNTGGLQLTSIYGVRRYHNGSVLRMHVDTPNTHVISAIINVNQEDIPEGSDWPLLILDHEHREHWISMRPGDLVLYESARLLHGRPTVFTGGAYDNVFIHYMPEDEDSWDYAWI